MASRRSRQRQQHDKRQWCEPTDSVKTGWPPGMLQDDSPEVASQIDTQAGDLQQERIGEVEMHNAEVSGLSTRPPGYRAGTELGEK